MCAMIFAYFFLHRHIFSASGDSFDILIRMKLRVSYIRTQTKKNAIDLHK